ncbi:MAG: hypothetical protein ACYSTL_05470, partial [Planctomycetota bacterium]
MKFFLPKRRNTIILAMLLLALAATSTICFVVRRRGVSQKSRQVSPGARRGQLSKAALDLIELARTSQQVELLGRILDTSQPAMQGVVDTARKKGMRSALDELRRHHGKTPPSPYLSSGFWDVDRDVRTAAEDLITKGLERGGHDAFPLDVPIPWGSDPFGDRSWRHYLNAWNFLECFAVICEQEPDEQYLRFARKIALDWIEQNIIVGIPNDFAWYDLATGRRAAHLAFIIDRSLRETPVKDTEILSLLLAARIHAIELSD